MISVKRIKVELSLLSLSDRITKDMQKLRPTTLFGDTWGSVEPIRISSIFSPKESRTYHFCLHQRSYFLTKLELHKLKKFTKYDKKTQFLPSVAYCRPRPEFSTQHRNFQNQLPCIQYKTPSPSFLVLSRFFGTKF